MLPWWKLFLQLVCCWADQGAKLISGFAEQITPKEYKERVYNGTFAFLNSWNDFLSPLVYLNSEKKYTVALGLQLFTGSYRGEWNLMMAAACLVLAPVVIVFAIGQKYLVEGVTMYEWRKAYRDKEELMLERGFPEVRL